MKKLVYTGPDYAGEIVKEVVGSHYEVIQVEPTPESLLPQFHQCSVFLDASMKVKVSAEDVAKASQLELIVTATTGASHLAVEALAERNIPLLTLKGQTEVLRGITASAELSWALLMACARSLRGAFTHVHHAYWDRTQFPGMMLRGKRLGVIGFGRNGSWMARYGAAFGMEVQAYDPFITQYPDEIRAVDLDELLASSDFISLHVHLSEETRGMLDADKISHMKKGAVFINTSRGELVDEHALVAALQEGRLAGVGCDVLQDEPNIEANVLWQYGQHHANVHITPHIGGFCPDAVNHVVRFSAKRILDHAEGRA